MNLISYFELYIFMSKIIGRSIKTLVKLIFRRWCNGEGRIWFLESCDNHASNALSREGVWVLDIGVR